MYRISDTQIDYILNDISARGVEMESLQQNLLDHVCCIIEQNLEADGDFESFYQKTIKTFYKDVLWEIEEETLLLLTYKNYYTMKKIMIFSGIFSAAAMIFGIFFKFMHWPGAGVFIILGIGTSSLVFLPLLFLLKVKDSQQAKDKIILGFGILSGILLSLSILFKVMHWPYSMILGYSAIISLGLILLPLFFFTGIKKPEEKINTITMSLVMIMVCGLWLTLIRSPKSTKAINIKNTTVFLINEQIVATEKKLFADVVKSDRLKNEMLKLANQIVKVCDEIKSSIVLSETGSAAIPNDFDSKDLYIHDNGFNDYPQIYKLNLLIFVYNTRENSKPLNKIITLDPDSRFDPSYRFYTGTKTEVLNQLTQIQLIVLQNERSKASK
ncbi:MAG: hypothetical protein K0S53_1145 [Bacteroidetes bacterium]|jgi:hypothetical protein|nr:hypothetical protein [Bacteroidota bacterium]